VGILALHRENILDNVSQSFSLPHISKKGPRGLVDTIHEDEESRGTRLTNSDCRRGVSSDNSNSRGIVLLVSCMLRTFMARSRLEISHWSVYGFRGMALPEANQVLLGTYSLEVFAFARKGSRHSPSASGAGCQTHD
jgi:hypothetical protein